MSGRGRYWLVGASEGLGRALANAMSRAGYELVLSARSTERLEDLAAELPGPAEVVPLDVTDPVSCAEAAKAAGHVDGLVYIAAVYWPMRAQDWDGGKAAAMCDVNLTGAMRILDPVLPEMIRRDSGHLLFVGSLAGFRGLPGAIGYAASKAGLMGLAESLHADLHKTGVRVQLANPGFIRTRLTDLNDFPMPYIMEPEAAADRIMAHLESRRFACSFPRPFSWLFRAAQFLPEGLYFRLFAR
ncbi:SDR family NAD(P)-dependent oxidoreductase [Tropicimonas sediminicola]|uniref:Short-chain dehydrogenase n=1 Tax=Tropicimonas sediminicola TaxID=1031541 RepID=A0A239IJG2_9RHOB|nr:SDR family NAD(P)-dependent oxidoreductase [Tropicimonas sediminicola]SNS93691.1 Short-chain dehydrogenase [Tropicimonas sediminicola]